MIKSFKTKNGLMVMYNLDDLVILVLISKNIELLENWENKLTLKLYRLLIFLLAVCIFEIIYTKNIGY